MPLLVTFLAGTYPAFYLSNFKSVDIIKGKLKTAKAKSWTRGALVTFQFIAFITLIFSTIIIWKQVYLLKNQNPGYDKENILVVSGTFNLPQNSRMSFKNELLQNPSVISASYSSTVPTINDNSKMIFRLKGNEKYSYINYIKADADFQKTLKIELHEGRFFRPNDNSENNNIILNKSAAKILGWSDSTTNIIQCDNLHKDFNVVGIVNDFNMESLRETPTPLVILQEETSGYLSLRLYPGNPTQTIKEIKEKWSQFKGRVPFDYFFLDKTFDAQYKVETRLGKLISILTLTAILIACMGLLGLVSFNTIQRIKEIGIRKVNGAKVSEILTMLNKDFVKWVVIAFVIATPVAYYAMNKWLENFAYKTNLSWWIFALAGLLALGIALLTVSFQSWKAATRNPVEALRYE